MSDIWAQGKQRPEVVFRRLGYEQGVRAGTAKAAELLEITWKSLVGGSGGGGGYYVNTFATINGKLQKVGTRGPHRPSAPGDFPARDSGRFQGSIRRRNVTNKGGTDVTLRTTNPKGVTDSKSLGKIDESEHWQVYSTDIASRVLEFGLSSGTPGAAGPHPAGIVIQPRPSARPAVNIALPQMKADIVGAIRANRKAGNTVSLLNLVRRGIIQFSTTIGNLNAIGLRIPILNTLRGNLLRAGRGLGDLNALAKGKIDQRIARRIVGRGIGRTIGEMTSGAGKIGGRIQRRALSGPAQALINKITIG